MSTQQQQPKPKPAKPMGKGWEANLIRERIKAQEERQRRIREASS